MALIFFNGFDYQAANLTIDGWSADASATVAGRYAGRALSFTGAHAISRPLGANYTTFIAGIAFKRSTNTGAMGIFRFLDAGTTQVGVGLNASNQLIVFRNSSANTLATGTTVLANDIWYFIELKATINNTTGVIELKLNGASEIASLGSLNTRQTANNYVTDIGFGLGVTGHVTQYDDFYFCDTTGSAPNNTFLGEVRVDFLIPTGAGSSTQFTPSAGSNFQNVDDNATPDGDTTYNQSSTAGHVDLFALGNIPTTPATIFGVSVVAEGRKDDAGVRTFRTKLKSGGTTSDGATAGLTTSFLFYRTQYELDPNTAAAWTQTNVDALEGGYECVA